MSRLQKESESIKEQLEELPPKELKTMHGYLGYHSALVPECAPGETLNNTLDFHLQPNMEKRINTIVLMPASNPRYKQDTAYGFPRRFKIELRESLDTPPLKTFDYSTEDYEMSQLTPLLISDIGITAPIIRIVVDRGVVKDGWEYFALGEVFVFCDGQEHTRVNIAPYSKLVTTDSFESVPTWSPFYINDRITAYDMPLGPKTKSESDFVAILPFNEEDAQIQVVIDLEEPRTVGRIEFFPAKPPWEISLPHFGYPRKIVVETFPTTDFEKGPTLRKEITDSWDETRSMVLGDIFFSIPIYSTSIRYVRITFSDLPIHGSSKVFAMGEISVLISGFNASKYKPVSVSGITQQGLDPSLLVDNFTYNHEIIHPEQWLIGLAKRNQLEARLSAVNIELATVYEHQYRLFNGALYTILLIAVTWALAMYLRARLSRKRELNQIRNQISSDLHDDVGSSISAFSLGMERLRNHEHSPVVDKVTQDLRIMAKEAAVALREAVWLTKQDSISLQDLGTMFKDRAYFILGKERVVYHMEDELPEFDISLVHKRNMMLLFKEALHNFTKHAHAELLFITFRKGKESTLVIQIEDNGVGITEKDSQRRGWGLSTMDTRAKQMGGELKITSTIGKGTRLELRIPISTLRKR